MAEVYLGLGSNLGDRRQQLRAALSALAQHGVHALRTSSLYETAPMYEADQPFFLNAVVHAETDLTPEDLLLVVKDVEHQLGRQERQRYGPREIDIDILLYAGQSRDSPTLTIPHPRLAERVFVQVPLAELRGESALGLTPIEGVEWSGLPAKPEKVRAFVAVDIDDRLRAQVARVQNALKPALAGVKWVDPRLCHLTLKFLGYVTRDRLAAISDACREATEESRPFEMGFRGVGGFPRLRNARVLWMGLDRGQTYLADLQAAVERELLSVGFEPENRPFSPHLTLGRLKSPPPRAIEDLVRPFEHQRFGAVSVDSLRLMQSVLHRTGPKYSVMEAFPLG